jgi:Flp pilus assembly protein TadD
VRATGFAKAFDIHGSAARGLLIVALGLGATSCSSLPSMPHLGALLSGHDSTADKAASDDLLHQGDSAREHGDLDTAATDYAKAAALDPRSLDAQLRLGAIGLARKDNDGALAAYEAAQRLAPKDPEAAFRHGAIELTRGHAETAADQFTIALDTRQDDPKLYNAMGVALSMQGKYDQAKQSFDKGLAIEPDYPALRNNYGLMQLASGDLAGALATFSALVASPQTSDRYRFNRALVELAMGQTDAALADAPGMDEPGLRQTLATYLSRPQDDSVADATKRIGKVLVNGADAAPSVPSVHLTADMQQNDPGNGDPHAAPVNPVAVLPQGETP